MAATSASSLRTLFSDVKNVYFKQGNPLLSTALSSLKSLEGYIELPVLEGGVTFDTGEAEKTEVKLTTGAIWTSKIDKGDSDISFQVASVDDQINNIFLNKISVGESGSAKDEWTAEINGHAGLKGHGYSNAPKKVIGVLLMCDESETNWIILPNVEMFGSLVSDDDNPAYFNVKVTPVETTEGASIFIFNTPKAA